MVQQVPEMSLNGPISSFFATFRTLWEPFWHPKSYQNAPGTFVLGIFDEKICSVVLFGLFLILCFPPSFSSFFCFGGVVSLFLFFCVSVDCFCCFVCCLFIAFLCCVWCYSFVAFRVFFKCFWCVFCCFFGTREAS